MSVYDLARALGEEILKSPETERVMEAKKAYESDEKATSLIEEYNNMQREYQEKIKNPNITKEEYQKATDDMRNKAAVIEEYSVTAELIEAENNFNRYLQAVFQIVTNTIAGEDPTPQDGGCSGSCGTCGGCH